MGDISKNISRHELACHCGRGFDSMDVETIEVWQHRRKLSSKGNGYRR